MVYRTVFALISLIFISCNIKEEPAYSSSQIRDVLDHTNPVRSIDPADTIFSDLEFFRSFVGDAAIVLLGEQSHGDGSTFLAKTRLIKFLHREMGFTVVAFECGMYETELGNRYIREGIPVKTAVGNSLFTIWTQSRQCQPLWRYIQESQSTPVPLQITGFDMQVSNRWGRDSLLPAIKRIVPMFIGNDTVQLAAVTSVLDSLKRSQKSFKQIDSLSRLEFNRSLDGVRHSISINARNNDEARYWLQLMQSLKTYINFLWNADFNKPDPAVFNRRDEQMAQNLLWLLRNKYKGKKIVVWAATSHIAKNRHEIVGRNNADAAMVPMGHHLWNILGDSIRIVGFTAYQGRVGARGRNPWDLAAAKPGTLEDALFRINFDHSFFNFRSVPHGHWLRDTIRARPFGYATMNARWARMIDGMFYAKTMIPSDKVSEE